MPGIKSDSCILENELKEVFAPDNFLAKKKSICYSRSRVFLKATFILPKFRQMITLYGKPAVSLMNPVRTKHIEEV